MRDKNTTNIKALIIIVVICLCLVLPCSCMGGGSNLFAYTEDGFSTTVKGSVDGISIEATVHFEPPIEGEQTRIMTVSYSAPESLEGITVSLYSDGTARSRLGSVDIGGAFHGFAEPFLAICPEGDCSSVSLNGDGDATVVFDDGKNYVKYYFEKGVRLPSKIEGRVSGRQLSLKLIEK